MWGILDLAPALERLLMGISKRLPVEVFLPDVPAADAPLTELRRRLIDGCGEDVRPDGVPEPASTLSL